MRMKKDQSMNGMEMPTDAHLGLKELEASAVIQVGANVDWKDATGFGKNAAMVAMMNEMMVTGSGAEGMKMAPMKLDFGPENFATIGPVVSQSASSPGTNETGTGASMGADHTASGPKQSAPGSTGQTGPVLNPDPAILTQAGLYSLVLFHTTLKVGENTFEVAVKDSKGSEVGSAIVIANVRMVEMDMGTAQPSVSRIESGRYHFVANFSMVGKWAIDLTISIGSQKDHATASYTVNGL